MISEQIKSGGQRLEYVFIINSLLTIYHAPTAKKISENQQKEIYSKLQWYIFMLKFVRKQHFIRNSELFVQHLFRGGVE